MGLLYLWEYWSTDAVYLIKEQVTLRGGAALGPVIAWLSGAAACVGFGLYFRRRARR